MRMVNEAEQSGHDAKFLLVYDTNRFGRLKPEQKIYWEEHLRRNGLQVVYVKDDFRNDGSIGDVLTKVVKHSEAHQFSVKLSELTLRGAKSHAALGHSAGGAAPYGYDRLLIDGQGNPVKVLKRGEHKADKMQRVVWQPSPSAAPVVRWIFETYEKGAGLHRLADELNERKTSAPRGRYWSKTMRHYILRNRAYLGERIYNKRSYRGYRRGEKGSLLNAADQVILKEAAHEPLIDRELFHRVHAILKTRFTSIRTNGNTYQKTAYLLTGLAFCEHCGYRMTGYPKTGNGHKYLTYTCSGYHRIGKSICRSVHVLTDSLEQTVVQSIRDHITAPEWKGEVYETLETMIKEEFGDGAETRVKEFQEQLTAVNRQIANIVDAIKTSGRFSDAINLALADLETQRDRIRSTLSDAEKRLNQQIGAETLADKIMAYYGQFDRIWNEGLTLDAKKEVLKSYVHHVNIEHSATHVQAKVALYKVPVPQTQQTLGASGLEPLIPRVSCGGRI